MRNRATSPAGPQVLEVLRDPPGEAGWNMAVDDALLATRVELGVPILRFYAWKEPAATFGYSQSYAEIERITRLRPLIRRPTGGGLVPHDRDWTYSLALPPNNPWYALSAVESYRTVHAWIVAAFARLDIVTELAPCCRKEVPGQCFVGHEQFDVLWGGRKIAGAAQRRNQDGLLIQGSIQPPPRLERDRWEQAFVEVRPVEYFSHWSAVSLPDRIRQRAEQGQAERFGQDAFHRRR